MSGSFESFLNKTEIMIKHYWELGSYCRKLVLNCDLSFLLGNNKNFYLGNKNYC